MMGWRHLSLRSQTGTCIRQARRLVGRWGGVRETMRVELTSGGGAFPARGMGERCKLPHRGLGRSLSSFATFTMLDYRKFGSKRIWLAS